MKKKIGISFVLFVTILGTILFLFTHKKEKPFYLEDTYYGTNAMIEIKMDELNELINNKKSFVVFIYQPMCITSSDFENVLSSFLEEKQISIYKIAYSNIKDTKIGKTIKYYPSFIIYHNGKIVDFLEANKEEDVEYYTSKEGFKSWFLKYVIWKDGTSTENKLTPKETEKEENNHLEKVNLENVKKEENKVNIYFFWGQGCPHCEKEFAFFESIKEKYGKYYNLYSFETWYDKENAELLYTFAEVMNDKVTGVPYTIIGNKTFVGFGDKDESDFIHAIEKQYKNNFDVYFNKIKK